MSNTPIEHVIVLMLENRSFDHMCGYWNRLPRGSGLTGEEFNYVDPADPSTAKISVHQKKLDPEQRNQPEPGTTWRTPWSSSSARRKALVPIRHR